MIEKLKAWRLKLLDTGKRNKLLNFRESKRSTLKITHPEFEDFYSGIVSGNTYTFPLREDENQDTLFNESLKLKVSKDSIICTKSYSEQNKSLNQLRLRTKTAIEELGINILYLAFGFLEWSEVEYSNETIFSPLLLVPVELKKESILDPYTLTFFEDDIVINPTLCYKLENDFGVKIEYDIDADTFKVQDLLEYISNKVNRLNWEVNNDVQLSLFSFLKLNMYKDLEKNELKILENRIIKALCGEQSDVEIVPQEIMEAKELDKLINPIDTFQVVDADSSQQQAIIAAKNGISFVLQGPPGTGKSQTITNIIAECLAENKRVLFVSEKLAALEVVYRNLQRVNLDDFCLQLHSHKAHKALVVKELSDTLNKPKTQANGDLNDTLEDLITEREYLNKFTNVLHEIRLPLGKTIFQIHGEIEKYSQYPDIQFKFDDIDEKTIRDVKDYINSLNAFTNSVVKVGTDYKANCFYGFNKLILSFELQKELALHMANFVSTLKQIQSIISEAKVTLSLKEYERIEELPELISVLELILIKPKLPTNWLIKYDFSETKILLKRIFQKYQTLIECENEVFEFYEKDIINIDANGMLHRFKNEYSSVFRIIKSNYIKDKKLLRSYSRITSYKIKYRDAVSKIEAIKHIQEISKVICDEEGSLYEWLGDSYKGRTTNWDYLFCVFKWISDLKSTYTQDNITECFSEAVTKENAVESAEILLKKLNDKEQILALELDYLSPFYDSNHYNFKVQNIDDVISKFSIASKNTDYLPEWVEFINAQKNCTEIGLQNFITEVENEGIPINQYIGVLLKRFYLLWTDGIYQKESVLPEFNREKFETITADFQKKDKSQFAIAQARIRQKISAQRPAIGGFTSRGTEIHILLNEAEKRRKILPIRKLFEKIPNLVLTLKPCLLMSPLSVSLFLNPDLYTFDTVIFDEASQVCTENAIGAIYRGKQLIVVGDREQLPPTNFFAASTSEGDFDTNEDEDDDETDIGAYESILDECGGILNKLSLLWHYRSRHEHLIAYSNAKIYKTLITFPTPIDVKEDLGVEFIYVPNGVYERSTSRTNIIEAKRVAEIVFEHFTKYPKRSLGVVTFSGAQQNTIDNEISILRKAKPQYEPFFDETKDESFFVKNLENVQGDERDTIIFSVGYGKDREGRTSVSFGPLNRDGGYRRLNVAITRAKFNFKLVSSILPTDIDLNRTESRGVRMLRGYMDFAMRGKDAILDELTIPEALQFDSPFEMQVFDILKNHGFEVDTQVGCSGYRIDLAVRHPSLSGRYIIAIECDGATYHSARTARERDRLREDVLKMRGWRIHRIWSTDWVRHRPTAIERLLKDVNDALVNYPNNEIPITKPESEKQEAFVTQLEQKVVCNENLLNYFDTYSISDISAISRNNPRGDKYYVADVITHIVNSESPVHKEVIYRYLAPSFGREKVTSVVTNYVDHVVNNCCLGRFIVKDDFFWSNTMKTPIFRVPKDGCEPRDIKLICSEELAEGMKVFVSRAVGIEKNALFKEVTRALGFNRTGDKITTLLSIALDQLLSKGFLEIKGEYVKIK